MFFLISIMIFLSVYTASNKKLKDETKTTFFIVDGIFFIGVFIGGLL